MRMIRSGVVDVQARGRARRAGITAIRALGRPGRPGQPQRVRVHGSGDRAGGASTASAASRSRTPNHWMRGGSYGWQAADAGVIGICWTNTLPNVPPWGASEPRIGNNPLIIAIPRPPAHVVLDMAMSQFSVGALASYRTRGERSAGRRRLRRRRSAHNGPSRARSVEATAADRLLEGIRPVARARHGGRDVVRRPRDVSDLVRARAGDRSVAGLHRDWRSNRSGRRARI